MKNPAPRSGCRGCGSPTLGASAPGSRERQAAEAPPVRASQSHCREFAQRGRKTDAPAQKTPALHQTCPDRRGQRRSVWPPRVWLRSPHRSKTGAAWTRFNPRCPCGQRHPSAPAMGATYLFQSTLPLRAATANMHIFFFPAWTYSLNFFYFFRSNRINPALFSRSAHKRFLWGVRTSRLFGVRFPFAPNWPGSLC